MKKHIEHDRTNQQFMRVIIVSVVCAMVLVMVIKMVMI